MLSKVWLYLGMSVLAVIVAVVYFTVNRPTALTPGPEAGGTVFKEEVYDYVLLAKLQVDSQPVFYQAAGQGDWLPASSGQTIQAADLVKTGAGGAATVTFFDSSEARLDQNTEIQLLKLYVDPTNPLKQQTAIQVTVGRIWARILKLLDKEASYTVRSSTAVATVRGTAFSFSVDQSGETTVDGAENTVAVASFDPAAPLEEALLDAVPVKEGEQAVIKARTMTAVKEKPRVAVRTLAAAARLDQWFQKNEEKDLRFLERAIEKNHPAIPVILETPAVQRALERWREERPETLEKLQPKLERLRERVDKIKEELKTLPPSERPDKVDALQERLREAAENKVREEIKIPLVQEKILEQLKDRTEKVKEELERRLEKREERRAKDDKKETDNSGPTVQPPVNKSPTPTDLVNQLPPAVRVKLEDGVSSEEAGRLKNYLKELQPLNRARTELLLREVLEKERVESKPIAPPIEPTTGTIIPPAVRVEPAESLPATLTR